MKAYLEAPWETRHLAAKAASLAPLPPELPEDLMPKMQQEQAQPQDQSQSQIPDPPA